MNYIISKDHGTAIYGVGAIRGCAAAHLVASRQPLRTVVLEADAVGIIPQANSCHRGLSVMPIGLDFTDADVLYLGLSSVGLKHRICNERITRLQYCLGTHAYQIITEHGRKLILQACLEAIEKNKHLDVCIAERMSKGSFYAYRKPLYVQGPETNRYYKLTNISV